MKQLAHDLFAFREDRQRGLLRAEQGRGVQHFKFRIWPAARPGSVQYEVLVGAPMMPVVVNEAMTAARRPAVRMALGWSIRTYRAFIEWDEPGQCHWRIGWNDNWGEALSPQTRSRP